MTLKYFDNDIIQIRKRLKVIKCNKILKNTNAYQKSDCSCVKKLRENYVRLSTIQSTDWRVKSILGQNSTLTCLFRHKNCLFEKMPKKKTFIIKKHYINSYGQNNHSKLLCIIWNFSVTVLHFQTLRKLINVLPRSLFANYQ